MSKTMSGPMVLLQHWAWSRLPCGRPRALNNWEPNWREENHESCPAFGEKWCCRHEFREPHGTAGVSYFRSQLQKLREDMVDWKPYEEKFSVLPLRVHQDMPYCLARVPLIHFWIVEHHYPDRVMRQFGLRQTILVLEPLPEHEVRRLHKIVNKPGHTNWASVHESYVGQASDYRPYFVERNAYFTSDQIEPYLRWFYDHCMYIVFWDQSIMSVRTEMRLEE